MKEPKPRREYTEGWEKHPQTGFTVYEALAPRLRSRGALSTQDQVDMLVLFATSYALRTMGMILAKRFGPLIETNEGIEENPVLEGVLDGNDSALAATAALGLDEDDLRAADEAMAPYLEALRERYAAEGIDLDLDGL
jgi:hypothetical protein